NFFAVYKEKNQKEEAKPKEEKLYKPIITQSVPLLEGIDPKYKIYDLLKSLIASDTNFEDPDFPATLDSLTTNTQHKYYSKYFVKAPWTRPHEMFDCDYDQIHMFDQIDPADIRQGVLGVCYFLSSLSCIAEFPSRLMKPVITQKANKYGAY